MQHNLELWKEALQERQLKINIQKTKIMVISNRDRTLNIQIDGKTIEQVKEFKYLGAVLDNKGKQERDITERIDKAIKTYYGLCKGIVRKKEVSRQTKMLVYKTIFLPVLTYGSETWTLTSAMKSKIQAAEMKYLRAVKGVTKQEHIRNQDIRDELQTIPTLEVIKKKQMSWWGHLQRAEDTKPVKQIWEAKIKYNRGRGRPPKTWNQEIGNILKEKEIDWKEARRLAQNRTEWRKII